MRLHNSVSGTLNCLHNAVLFFRKHFLVIVGLGLIAALGRVMQLGGFGPISAAANIILELVIESARMALFLFVLGLANIRSGLSRIKRFFTHAANRRLQWNIAIQNLKKQWMPVLFSLLGFLLIAWGLNFLIDLLAYETCFYLNLKRDGILAPASSEWTVLLFFKNISVIPFTLVFETLLLLWLTNKLKDYRTLA